MHEQTSLFGEDAPPPRQPRDSKGARQAAREAMEQISENTSPAWRNAAEQAVYRTCAAKAAFLVDDVWTEFERVDGDFAYAGVHDKRAMGPLVISAAKAGWCESTKTAQHSAIVGNHGNLRTVWKSKIYQNPPESERKENKT